MKQTTLPIPSGPGATLSRITNIWHKVHRQAAEDFRARWRRCALWLLIAIWFTILLVTLIVISTITNRDFGACQPDGSFAVDPYGFQYWSSSGFFQITLGFGEMSFTQVKAIDIVWDILVGRGGQAIVAYISWRVFVDYVTTSMETAPITLRTYRTIFMPGNSLIIEIPRTIRDFAFRYALQSRIAMSFIIFTMAFTLAFPTLASAMTGYTGNVEAFVNTTENNYVPFESFNFATFIIHDGSRIRLGDEYIVTQRRRGYQPVLWGGTWDIPAYSRCGWAETPKDSMYPALRAYYDDYYPEDCYIGSNVTSYVGRYGLFGDTMENSTFMGHDLPTPVLNISAFYVPDRYIRTSEPYGNNVSYGTDESLVTWEHGDVTYDLAEINKRGKCQAVLNYQWGFSFILLFFTVLLLLIWTLGVYLMWLSAHFIMERRGRREVAGEYKAVLEFASAMQTGLPNLEHEREGSISGMSEKELRHRITKDMRGGSISYATPLLPNKEGGHGDYGWNPKEWIANNRWSIAAMLACITITIVSAFELEPTTMFLFPLPLECAIAIYIGSSRMSRGVLFFWFFVLLSIVPQLAVLGTLGIGSL